MNGILLPGWNLAGVLPRASTFRGVFGIAPGKLIRVPRAITFVNVADNSPSEFARIAGFLPQVIARIAAAMPDASVVSGRSAVVTGNGFGGAIPLTLVNAHPGNGRPVLGFDYLEIDFGTFWQSVPSNLGAAIPIAVAQSKHMAGYASRVFGLSGSTDTLDAIVAACVAAGLDVKTAGTTEDATEDSVAAIISDHYGVPI